MSVDPQAVVFVAASLLIVAAVSAAGLALLATWLLLRRRRGPTNVSEPTPAEPAPPPALSGRLARAQEPRAVAEVLLDEVAGHLGVQVVGLAVVDEDRRAATVLAVRKDGQEVASLSGSVLDLENEPSGIASAVFGAAPFAVYDAPHSLKVNRRIVEALGAKSVAYVPLIAGEQVIAVLVAASTGAPRTFGSDELGLMQTLAAEAALALERTRSASALQDALERERLIARIARKVRSELDVDAVLSVAVVETGKALRVQRVFVRLGGSGAELELAAEWTAAAHDPIGERAPRLPVSNLAARERRTVAFGDVRAAPELDDPALGGRELTLELGTLAVLATPIVVFGEMIGVFGVHRATAGAWSPGEVALAEAVAREVGLALHTARLLRENSQRLEQQAGLLRAAQALTGELELEPVLERLVEQVAQLLAAEAVDCYLLVPERGVLRCAAVYGLDPALLGFEFARDAGLAGRALVEGRPVMTHGYDRLDDPVPHPAYEGFTGALVAPMVWSGTVRGVLGVGSRTSGRIFTEGDAELLEAFAGLASLALRNAESFAERTRQARVQRGFYRIAAALAQPLSLVETLEAVATAAGEALGGDFAVILRPRDGTLGLTGARTVPEGVEAIAGGKGLPPGAAALVSAATARRVLAAPAVADDDRFDASFRDGVLAAGFRALLAVPVETARAEQPGLVVVFFAEERPFTDDDLELATHLAGATRAALDRSELFEAERTSRALAQQLARTGSLLATELDPAAVLEEVVQRAPALLGVEACTIRLLEGEELIVSAASGEGAEAAIGAREPSTGWLSAEVVQCRAPVAVENLEDGSPAVDPMVGLGYRSFLGVPLVGPEGVMHGVLSVYGAESRSWREEEIEALSALAANTSSALSNAELYQRVADEKERSTAIIENIADGIVAVDRDGEVVLWNRAAEGITGVPQSEALGRTPAQVLRRRLESEDDAPGGNRLVSIDRGDEEVWLSLTEAVMHDPAGQVAGRIFAFRDISADRYVEEMKSDFVSAVSHELRSPLTSIYGFAETLLRQDVLFGEEERRTFLGYIASESERLTAIVDALLNIARLESGDLQVNLNSVDVNAVVVEAVSSAEEAAGMNEHRFVLELPTEPVAAEADGDRLRQILGVLLDNAVKYSPNGGTVTVAARRNEQTVEIEVADEGIGIPAHEQERIFRKFYRAEGGAGARRTGGTGLGLFIAQGLVLAMGGRIWVTSAEGEGARFGFELPLAAAPVASVRE